MQYLMKLKANARISTGDFWYDLLDGGYLKPEDILENKEDVEKVKEAIKALKEFVDACEDIIVYQ